MLSSAGVRRHRTRTAIPGRGRETKPHTALRFGEVASHGSGSPRAGARGSKRKATYRATASPGPTLVRQSPIYEASELLTKISGAFGLCRNQYESSYLGRACNDLLSTTQSRRVSRVVVHRVHDLEIDRADDRSSTTVVPELASFRFVSPDGEAQPLGVVLDCVRLLFSGRHRGSVRAI